MTTNQADYLIIGNSAAGLSAAETVRSLDADAKILIVSDEPYRAYGRPLISYLIEGAVGEQSIWLHDEDYYQRHGFDTLFGYEHAVAGMDAEAHTVQLASGDVVCYGKCLVATGSSPYVPDVEGLDGQENIYTFTTLDQAKLAWEEARRITREAHDRGTVSRVMVSGAGLVGLKAAEALTAVVDEVLVVGRAPFLLRAVLDPVAGPILQAQMEPHGITFRLGVTASKYLCRDNRVVGAVLGDGSEIEFDMLIMASGVRPNCGFAVEAGAVQGKGLVVDGSQQTNLPDVYAAGDVAQVENLLNGSMGPLAQWPNAVRQGRVAGYSMVGVGCDAEERGNYPVNSTNFFGASVVTCGLTNPAGDLGYDCLVEAGEDSYAKFVTKDGKLYGYVLINRSTRAGIYTDLIGRGVPLDSLEGDPFAHVMDNLDFSRDERWSRLHNGYPSTRNRLGWKEA